MPKLWTDTVEAHRREVREAIIEATLSLVSELGLRGATMSQIAERTGIGRATLYKYFPDVESILLAWHGEQISHHLRLLAEVRDRETDPGDRLRGVLEAYALVIHQSRGHGDTELTAWLHRDEQVAHAQHQLRHMVRDLIAAAAKTGHVRGDVAADELTTFCLHALSAAGTLPSKAAVRRLVAVVVAGLRAGR